MARVCVDVPLAHLDRPFDYLVPADADGRARPGVRVRVRFAGALTDGWLLDRVAESTHPGRLAYLERVVSPEPVLSPEIARLARAVADRYAGGLADVLRLAVPPRHARVEQQQPAQAPAPPCTVPPAAPPCAVPPGAAGSAHPPAGGQPGGGPPTDARGWGAYPAGPAFLRALADGRAPRAVWSALPGED
ncbi:MAG TPA: hypothetical protein VNV66_05705, partial [Pilimelia sp.]|nr:hypothetical protein [Pilimelia sp.]